MPTTRITRLRELQVEDRPALDALLDDALVAHVGFDVEDRPVVIPTGVARDGDRILVHGSTGSRWMRSVAEGIPVCVTVTAVDGVVVARSAFESSLHYRSAVVFGRCRRLEGDDHRGALDVLVDKLIPGRRREVRPSSPAELRRTMVLALPIEDWSLKVSAGWPDDEDGDLAGPAWAGVVPLTLRGGAPRPAPDLHDGIPVPPSVVALSRR